MGVAALLAEQWHRAELERTTAMRDSDPPKCPRCEEPLRKLGARLTPGADPDDPNYVAAITYRCDECRLKWVDAMDGTILQLVGVAKAKRGGN